jgi:hypothetical protein
LQEESADVTPQTLASNPGSGTSVLPTKQHSRERKGPLGQDWGQAARNAVSRESTEGSYLGPIMDAAKAVWRRWQDRVMAPLRTTDSA